MINFKTSLTLFLFLAISFMSIGNGIISDSLQSIVSQFENSEEVVLSNEVLFDPTSLNSFYTQREMKPAWVDESVINIDGLTVLNLMSNVRNDGLNPDDYHYQKIITLKNSLDNTLGSSWDKELNKIHLELLITDGYLMMASHLNIGKLHPKTFMPEWNSQRERAKTNYADHLGNSLKYHTLEEDLSNLSPKQNRYQELKLSLAAMRNIESEGGWRTLESGPRLELDSVDTRVDELRKRLREEGYVISDTTDQELFDEALHLVVKEYQSNNGLESDGIVGAATIRTLNIPVADRIQQVIINLERWRWYDERLRADHIRVNITNYNLEVIENNDIVFDCKAIVGKTKRKTPEFNASLQYIVMNPYWRVPSGILTKDIIPAVKKDSSYMDKKRIRVLSGDSIVDSKAIDWQTENIWKYTYRQDPGKYNSMGLIKFMFPNSYNVYIHDTPSKSLFERTERTFSSGCIRIQKPVQLAEHLLKGHEDWDLDKIMQTLDDGDPSISVDLKEKIPVRILYYTAWGETGRHLQFRKDIYKKDPLVWKGLSANAPRP